MAEKITVHLVDDLDGSDAEETVRFAWDGRQLVIDLSKKNADKLRKAIEPFVAAGRPEGQTPARRTGGTPKAAKRRSGGPGRDTAQIRAWARENNISVPDRGRLKPDVIDAYDKAH